MPITSDSSWPSVVRSVSGSERHMKRGLLVVAIVAAGCGDGDGPTSPSGGPAMSFFVSSATSMTGNLGGLAGADALCQRLATAVGQGTGRLWRAYLSVERDASNGNRPTNARDRIGLGPWFNASG